MERFDICDENGMPTGETIERSEAHERGIRHRTVHIWVVREVDGRYEVLLQKRAQNKDSFPGRFDTSSAGHIQAGDEPLESALRELSEELGIIATAQDLSYAGDFRIKYEKPFHGKMFRDNEVTFVYVYNKPVFIEKLAIQKEELDCVEWFEFNTVYEACRARNQKFCVPMEGLNVLKNYLETMHYKASGSRYETMKYNRCGKSGLLLPAVSFGLWHNFGTNQNYENMRRMCFTAFDAGITHFDLANNYGPEPGAAERNFGTILKNDLASYRDELLISTKAGYDMWEGPYGNWGSRKYLIASLDQSLKRMQLDYVDIFYHHRMDPDTPLEETMLALDQIVRSGKALYVGLSNYDGETMLKATKILEELHTPFIINQNRYNMFDRTIEKNGLKEQAPKAGKGIITFSPLAQGLLTDRYLNGIPKDSRIATDGRFLHAADVNQRRMEQVRLLNEMAKERGQSLAGFALSWILKDDDITSVLIGASKPEQILDCVTCLKNTGFNEEELRKINEITEL